MLEAHSPVYVKMILTLLIKVVAFYIGAIIVQIKVTSLESLILRCEVFFLIFLIFNN